jgi:hypothetical protein
MATNVAGRRYRTWYAMLLRLYPRAFRERFGEGMAQTLHDLGRQHEDAKRKGVDEHLRYEKNRNGRFRDRSGLADDFRTFVSHGEVFEPALSAAWDLVARDG